MKALTEGKNLFHRVLHGRGLHSKFRFLSITSLTWVLYMYCTCSEYFHCASYERPCIPVDIGRKLSVHKTFWRRPGYLLNVLCTFSLRPVSMGTRDSTYFFWKESNCVYLNDWMKIPIWSMWYFLIPILIWMFGNWGS